MLTSILVFLIVICVIYYVLGMMPIPEPPRTLIYIVLGVILLLVLLGYIGAVPALF
jgi:hypothetical protein